MEAKIKHLEFIQQTINRMASNSFFLKGWTVTIIVGIFAFSNLEDTDPKFLFVVIIPVIFFWLLDSFYLHQERLYRKLYDKVRLSDKSKIDFSMNASIFKNEVASGVKVFISKTMLIFYVPLLVVVFTAIYITFIF